MGKIYRFIIRTSSFLRKEIFEVLRQPRLLLTLVLGPFLILLVFGVGYRNEARKLRTIFVVQPNSPLADQIKQYASTLGPQLVYEGVTSNEAEALQKLRNGQVDLVAVTPPNAYQTIRDNQPAVFILYHHEIDPFQVDYVKYFGQVYIDEVNRRVLLQITSQGQADASTVQAEMDSAQQNAAAMRQAMAAGNTQAARQEQTKLVHNLDNVSLAVGASLGLLSGVQSTLDGNSNPNDASQTLSLLTDLQKEVNTLSSTPSDQPPTPEDVAAAAKVEKDLADVNSRLKEFTGLSPDVIVRPFRSEARSIATIQPTALDFFAPAVISLLLQHLAVTFAALSIVRERIVGTMELFQVSPLSAGEALIGKYLSYLIFGAILTVALTLLLIFALRVPMLGSWLDYAAVILVLLFASLSYGFLISLLSQTDSQAVQYTMIFLLTSVFFSGFLMSLEMIWQPVRVISWALPTTYGIVLLRDIMLRGETFSPFLLGGLLLIGFALMLVSWFLFRRALASR